MGLEHGGRVQVGMLFKGAESRLAPRANVFVLEVCGWGEFTTATEVRFG